MNFGSTNMTPVVPNMSMMQTASFVMSGLPSSMGTWPFGTVAMSHSGPYGGLPTIEPYPEGCSVRFTFQGKHYTGQVVSFTQASPHAQPLYVVKPDTPLPKLKKKPIPLAHHEVQRVSPLQRFAEGVFAETPCVKIGPVAQTPPG